jgi:hypothetical protein
MRVRTGADAVRVRAGGIAVSIDRTIVIGPYVVCTGRKRGPRFELATERLREAQPMCDELIPGSRVFVASSAYDGNTSIYLSQHCQGEWAIPDDQKAIAAFCAAFNDELEAMGRRFDEVDLRFGVLAWSW